MRYLIRRYADSVHQTREMNVWFGSIRLVRVFRVFRFKVITLGVQERS